MEGLQHHQLLLLTLLGGKIIFVRPLETDLKLTHQKEMNRLNMLTDNNRLMINLLTEHWYRKEKLCTHQYP